MTVKQLEDESVDEFIVGVLKGCQPEDFDFSVDVDGTMYDVYHFETRGKRGQAAFAIINGRVEVAMFRAGTYSEEEVVEYVRQSILTDLQQR